METRTDPAIEALTLLIDRLHERGRPRVWSLVITVFGDAVLPRGGRVPLAVLQEIMARLRIEPGAVRTAMSRLAADGWVKREREGRTSHFRLASAGRHAFDLATRRIYASGPPDWDGSWTVAIAPPGDTDGAAAMTELGFLKMAGGVFLKPSASNDAETAAALKDMLVIHGTSAEHPEMLRSLWPSDDIAEAYRGFVAAFRPLAEALEKERGLAPLDAMAARTLLIHDWRRIVLRDPGLPPALLPEDWPGETARALTARLYRAIRPQSEAWLGEAGFSGHADAARFSAHEA